MWWSVGAVILLLWGAGIALERALARQLRLQEEADRRERLALIGQMTASLAHEIRNTLGSVKGYAQWVDEKIEASDRRKPGLAAVLKGTERIESLVNELLLYAREEEYAVERVDPGPLAETVLKEELSGWRGSVETDFRAAAPLAADPAKLRRVLSNGIRNALQAMGADGTLRVDAAPEGRMVRIRIRDSGPGIAASERGRLFTPFFTTKPDGTGLGLAYSKKVIEGMKGRVELDNRKDRDGAEFRIFLPKGH
jgi:two-component system sensor histidine kinase HydH